MIRLARGIIFLLFAWIWLVVMAIVCLPFLLLPRRWCVMLTRFWIRIFLKGLKVCTGLSHRIEGAKNLPATPCLIACKHQSAWETYFLMMYLADPAIILKRELLRIPFYGWYAGKLDHIAVNRRGGMGALKDMLRQAREKIKSGRSILIFPQGTRVRPGEQKPYQPGIAALYETLNVPVIPVALNSGLFWQKGQLAKKPGTLTVRFLAPIAPGLKRGEFMALLEDKIEKESRQLAKL